MERLDILLIFFLSEILNIKTETKNICNRKTSKVISSGNDGKIELLQNQNKTLKIN